MFNDEPTPVNDHRPGDFASPKAAPSRVHSWEHFNAASERDQNERDALSFERYLAQLAKQQDMIYDALTKGKA